MKFFKFLLTALAIGAIFTACTDNDPDEPEPAPTGNSLVLRSASIADGATVDAETTADVTLHYNNVVTVNPAVSATLNGEKITLREAGMEVTAFLSLKPGTNYKLLIPEGAVTLKDNAKVVAPAFTLSFSTKEVVVQDASAVDAAPVNAKATAEASTLYSFLRNSYGKVMFSGAMGGVAWETAYTDFISQNHGKYPAVVGFDYIHLGWSPANWIDYGDITPVSDVWRNGSIVTISWHWNVPKSQGSSDISFSADADVHFSPSNVMKPGTWENEIAEADIKKLAGYMKLLQDANIPVLWRPFHEAAGDYTWGAWFWWGKEGVEVTKQLYIWLYDKLTNQYGLNNLIWEWTMCTSSQGRLTDVDTVRAAYPGDEYVDIVGTDLYPDKTFTDQTAQFNLVNEVVKGKKMVALTECGNLIDPDKAKQNGALWLYFMQWYDNKDGKYGHFNYTGPQWDTILSNPLVYSAHDFSIK